MKTMSCSTVPATFPSLLPISFSKYRRNPNLLKPIKRSISTVVCLKHGLEEIAEIAQNKVLVAATVSAVLGQLSKPFTSAIKGNAFDFKAVIKSGGMPSSHSSAIVSAATCIGLERGFSDSIFGFSLIVAAIIMYDAQGVRKEVGKHAKILNKTLYQVNQSEVQHPSGSIVSSSPMDSKLINSSLSPLTERHSGSSNLSPSYEKERSTVVSVAFDETEAPINVNVSSSVLFKEHVGHSEAEVLAGAFFGFVVSLVLNIIMQ